MPQLPREKPKQWPRELGLIDPARVEETINVVNSVFKLKAPVAVNDVYAPGFVAK